MTPPKLKQIIEFDLSIMSEGAKQSNSCRFGIRDRTIGTYQYGGEGTRKGDVPSGGC